MNWKKYAPWLALVAVLLLVFFYAPQKAEKPAPMPLSEPVELEHHLMRGEQIVGEIRYVWAESSSVEQAVYINLREFQEQHLAQQVAYAEQLLTDAEFNGSLPEGELYYTYLEEIRLHYANAQAVSLHSWAVEHTYGAPNSLSCNYGYTFDAATGTLLTLADIWGEDAREKAAAEIYAQIEREGKTGDYFPNLAENLLSNLGEDDWYMDDEYLYIIYNPYEIAPYAMGIQEFKLQK